MKRRRVSVRLLALVGCLASCASGEAPAPPAEEPAPTAVAKPEPEPLAEPSDVKRVDIAPAEPPKVTVDVPGKDPKQVLRLSPAAGVEEKALMTMHMTLKMSAGGQKLPAVTTPPILIDMRGTVESVTDDTIVINYTIDGMRVGPSKAAGSAMTATMKSMLEGMKPFDAHLVMDRSGALTGGYVDVPTGLPPQVQQLVEQMQQSLGQIQVPLPTEPVGVGAKWTAVAVIEQGGLKIEQTAKYSLESREGVDVAMKVAVSQKLVDPKFSPPGMEGVELKVDMFQSGGSGTLALQLDHWSPVRIESQVKLKMGMSIPAPGGDLKQDLEMEMKMEMRRQ